MQTAETTTSSPNSTNAVLPAVPYQLCPKCSGQGTVSKPPYVAGDVYEWTSSQCSFICDVCDGKKIIPMYIIQEVPADE